MSKRDELRKSWERWKYARAALDSNRPKGTDVVEFDDSKTLIKAHYNVEHDLITIVFRCGNEETFTESLSGEEAEKLYHFLGGLYGE